MSKEQDFINLAKQYERLSDELDAVREELTAAMSALGVDKYVQDEETGAVYKTIKPNGTFVAYRDIGYKRTNLEGEKGGGGTVLSKKEAQEAGFNV